MTPLTREQLATFLSERLQLSTIAGSDTFGTILDHDAAWRQQLAEVTAERDAYRHGGLTEEILRRHDGYLKVGRGCAIVLESEARKEQP